jgi:hypothetical protein
MILIYSATLRMKFQGNLSSLFDYFPEDNSASVPAIIVHRGRACQKLENRGQQDHNRNNYGNALRSFMVASNHKQKFIRATIKESLS